LKPIKIKKRRSRKRKYRIKERKGSKTLPKTKNFIIKINKTRPKTAKPKLKVS